MNSLKNIIFIIFLIIFIGFVIDVFLIKKFLFSYVYEEWLINYSQGFIRRGFPGSILFFFNNNYKIDIFKIIKLFSYFTFLLFSSIYLLKVKQSKKILDLESLMVVLFLPSLILFPLHDPHVIGRKEILFFFGLFVNIFLLETYLKVLNIKQNFENEQDTTRIINQYCYKLFICYNLLSIPTALSHESIIFLSLPLNIIITSNFIRLKFSIKQVVLRSLIIYFPTIFIAFLCFIFQGNDLSSIGICQSWQEYINQYKSINCDSAYLPARKMFTFTDNVPLVLQYFGLPIRYFFIEVWTNNISSNNGLVFIKWLSAFSLCTIILIRISSRILSNYVEKFKQKIHWQYQYDKSLGFYSSINLNHLIPSFIFKYAFIPSIFSAVLYIIAQDWGRWFFVTSTSYTICLLSPGLILIEIVGNFKNKCNSRDKLQPKFLFFIYSTYLKILNLFCTFHSCKKISSIIYFLTIIFTLFILKIPHHSHFWDWSFKPWLLPWLNRVKYFDQFALIEILS
ncbi:hypothetical protein [Anabaena subtropica]|uniref:GPI mannosyltransferase 2 n=1 Tax=Anabaena subtropica FACHB-260 TaxID=2692884 RepID=A0ABR8CMK3_9NOST|nr:hypothetical protein [Anabaena subtropica]MBD2343407.1 hypothetical protein [Anabaena subtropica FACHB-260]